MFTLSDRNYIISFKPKIYACIRSARAKGFKFNCPNDDLCQELFYWIFLHGEHYYDSSKSRLNTFLYMIINQRLSLLSRSEYYVPPFVMKSITNEDLDEHSDNFVLEENLESKNGGKLYKTMIVRDVIERFKRNLKRDKKIKHGYEVFVQMCKVIDRKKVSKKLNTTISNIAVILQKMRNAPYAEELNSFIGGELSNSKYCVYR